MLTPQQPRSAEKAYTEVSHVSGVNGVYARVYLICPRGHEVASTPASKTTGKRWLAGDFVDETCGRTDCGWKGGA